jgi:hypothetical protein
VLPTLKCERTVRAGLSAVSTDTLYDHCVSREEGSKGYDTKLIMLQ